jgi:hypothetical protein
VQILAAKITSYKLKDLIDRQPSYVLKFGYIRVSSKDQNEGRQLEAIKKLGVDERDQKKFLLLNKCMF